MTTNTKTHALAANKWKPSERVVAGGGIGLAVANILAYYVMMPPNVQASVAVLITAGVTYFWRGKK